MEAPLQWECSRPMRPVAPTNGIVGAASDMSHPYKWDNL